MFLRRLKVKCGGESIWLFFYWALRKYLQTTDIVLEEECDGAVIRVRTETNDSRLQVCFFQRWIIQRT